VPRVKKKKKRRRSNFLRQFGGAEFLLKLIVGLGNPGPQYQETRHNIGFKVLDHFARRHAVHWMAGDLAETGEKKIAGESTLLAKPRTFMNRSGAAVRELLRENRLGPSNLVVVYDDLDLDLGRIRIRTRGSSGGHRGMESIIDAIGSGDFIRVRLGIGREKEVEPSQYVLRPFRPSERSAVESAVIMAADALDRVVAGEVDKAMNDYNRDK
jgi:PTH1 family peptidyl-tRNA hydrolase